MLKYKKILHLLFHRICKKYYFSTLNKPKAGFRSWSMLEEKKKKIKFEWVLIRYKCIEIGYYVNNKRGIRIDRAYQSRAAIFFKNLYKF